MYVSYNIRDSLFFLTDLVCSVGHVHVHPLRYDLKAEVSQNSPEKASFQRMYTTRRSRIEQYRKSHREVGNESHGYLHGLSQLDAEHLSDEVGLLVKTDTTPVQMDLETSFR